MDSNRPEKIRICHPSPDVRDAWVFPSAVPHWERAGWMTAEDFRTWQAAREDADAPAVDAESSDDSPPTDDADSEPSAQEAGTRLARKRRASKESS
ncbi:hypothetical protein [Actinomadura nitritigenes]|uniref:hypothetical protein n=1 Tax=Actinomadura nitritigenes TaxID=134602 RepID=UPI003D944EA8